MGFHFLFILASKQQSVLNVFYDFIQTVDVNIIATILRLYWVFYFLLIFFLIKKEKKNYSS